MTSITITGPEDTTGKSWDIANENGRLAHDIVSRGQELRHEMDFRSGGFGMGETVQQTEAGYFFTQNMDCSRRGIRLGPTIFTVSLASGFPGVPFFFEESDTFDETDFGGTATATSSTTVTDSTETWTVNQWAGFVLSIAGQNRFIVSNTSTVLTVGTAFSPTPGNVRYVIGGARYVYVTRKTDFNTVTISKIRAFDDTVRNTRDFDFASATNVDSMPLARFNGNWFHGISLEGTTHVDAHMRLDTVLTTTSNDTWTSNDVAVSLRGFFLIDQSEGTPTLARVRNKCNVELISTGYPLISGDPNTVTNANYGGGQSVGDNSWFVQGASSHAGLTLFGKNDNLFAWDPAGTSYPVIVTLKPTGVVTGEAGLGTVNYGSVTFYNHATLWMIRSITEVDAVGVDAIDYYSAVANIDTPIGYTYVEGAAIADQVYYAYVRGNNSYIKMLRIERHPTSKLPIIWDTIIYRGFPIRGMFVDGGQRLWWAETTNSRVGYIQLSPDGSPNSGARGNNESTYHWYGPDIDFGMPEVVKQMRYIFVELEGGVAAASWQFNYYRDSGSVDSIDSAFTASGGQHLNPTVGTTDTAFRFRPRLTCTTNESFSTTGTASQVGTSTSLTVASAGWTTNQWIGHVVYIREGYGAGQTRRISANTSDTLTVTPAWDTIPDASSRFVIAADPRVLRVVLYARTPDRYRTILKVEGTDKSMFEAEKALRKLKDAGPCSVREVGTNESTNCYIRAVNKIAYRDGGTTQTGIELQYDRFTVAA